MKTILFYLVFLSSFAHGARFVVQSKYPHVSSQFSNSGNFKILPFASVKHSYFSTLYTVTGNITKEELLNLPWVKEVEDTIELTQLSLLPADGATRLVSDELFTYQWSLLNQGQTYIREKDDIHNLPLKGIEGKDIGWKEIVNQIPKSKIIIAVLDSGVDLSHPDLKDNLWKNSNECGLDPKVDNDNNNLAGDCHGWNFTEAIDSEEAKTPQDYDGHGTHVAGIIAAAKNGFGIVGVNPNALIMPVKVMKDSNSKSEVATSESFAQGIIYATNMGAHIINLSLGWPRSLETKHLREAVFYALSKNVIIVAAAGNNNSSEPLYPCAYEGVICTAASTLDGKFAGFSNYGGHVDALVPGEAILSLNPILFEPEFFSVPGYDLKSGTSQASPLLAGMISLLKANSPTLSIDEVFGRLYSVDKAVESKKFIMGGGQTLSSLFKKSESAVVRPVLKRIKQIVLVGHSDQTKLVVPIRNYGKDSQRFQVRIEGLSSGIEFQSEPIVVESLKESELVDLVFNLRIFKFESESNVKIKITIVTDSEELSFFNELPVVRDIKSEAMFRKNSFHFMNGSLPLGSIVNGRIAANLSTVESYAKNESHEFYLRRNIKEEKKLEVTLFRRSNSSVNEVDKKILIDNFVSLLSFMRADLNFDGQEDYILQTVNEDSNGKFLKFSFFNKDLSPLWSSFPSGRIDLEVSVASLNDFSLVTMEHATLGKILVPAFFTNGQLPKIDQAQDFFGRWDLGKENRLYYLEPLLSDKKLRIRALTTISWKDTIRKSLNLKWFETIIAESRLPTTIQDANRGVVRLLVSAGQGASRKIFVTTFDVKSFQQGAQLPQLVVQSEGVDPLFSVTQDGLLPTGDTFLNIYDRSRSKIIMTKDDRQISQYNYMHESETDIMIGHIVSFEDSMELNSILQTRDELVTLTRKSGEVMKSSRPKLRYSFFSSKVLSEMYSPVIFSRNGKQSPALYVDSTSVTGNRVYLFEVQQGQLVSSIKNSLIVPPYCKAMNPAFSKLTSNHEFVFLCLEEKLWTLRTFEMN